MSTLGEATDVNPVIEFLLHTLHVEMLTPKGSMSTEGETLQFSVLTYRRSICPPLVTRQMSIL